MTAQRAKSQKVYAVHTAIQAQGKGKNYQEEIPNWAKYTLVAPDAELAISFAKVRFSQKGEYVSHVELIAVLDDQGA